MAGCHLTLEQRAELWETYQRKTPSPGQNFDTWAAKAAAHYKCSPSTIRAIITREREAMDLHIEHQSHTQAQQLAASMGLYMSDVFQTIKRNLRATRRELVYEEQIVHADEPETSLIEEDYKGARDGEPNWEKGTRKQQGKRTRAIRMRQPARDKNGQFVYFEQPDPKAQLMAAEQLGKILGVNSPEELALNVTHKHTIDLSEEELKRELRAAADELAKLQAIEIEVERIPVPRGRSKGSSSSKRLPLLDAQLHENGGRAGRDRQPHQAVPGQALLQAGPPGVQSRIDPLCGEEPHHDAVVDGSSVGDA